MFIANTYTVFIASPIDVLEERNEAERLINKWNGINSDSNNIALLPLRWENNVAPGLEKDGQSIINEKLLDKTDLLVAIFWSRIGSPTARSKSATIEEIEYHIDKKKPAMVFFCTRKLKEGYDIKQYEEVKTLKAGYFSKGLVKEFDTLENFNVVFSDCLQLKLNENKNIFSGFSIENKGFEIIDFENLSEEARTILSKMREASNGSIMVTNSKQGFHIQCGNIVLFDGDIIRDIVKWQDALEQLEKNNQIEKKSSTQYTITSKGLRNIGSKKAEIITLNQNKPRLSLALQWAHGYRLNKGLSHLNKVSILPIPAEEAIWVFEISNKYNLILKNVSKEPAWNIEIVNAKKIFDNFQKNIPLTSLNSGEDISLEVEFLQYYNGFGLDADKLPRIPSNMEGEKIIVKFENSEGGKFNSVFTLRDGKFTVE